MKKIVILLIMSFVVIQSSAQQLQEDYFITTWKTDNISSGSSGATSITIPTVGSGYNYDVSWKNDGNWETGFTGNATHDYGTAGTYTVAIRGSFPSIFFNNAGDQKKILSIDQWGDNAWSSMYHAFSGCNNLIGNATDTPNLFNVTDMSGMFSRAHVFNQYIGDWNVSNVTNMSNMFSFAYVFNQNIGNWDVSSVTSMRSMFSYAYDFNQAIGNWDVGNVIDMSRMFHANNSFNQDIGNWEVGSVTNMSLMFAFNSAFNQDIGNWDVSNVTTMSSMFIIASAFNQDIGNWDVSNVIIMESMFQTASAFDQDIGNWDVSSVINMWNMFSHTSAFNQDIGNWEVGNVTDMAQMFWSAQAFNQDIGNWDVASVTRMSYMFNAATAFNQDIGNWNVSNVTKMIGMFDSASAFNQDIVNWEVGNVTDMSYMFYSASVFDQNIANWNVASVTDMSNMFQFASEFDQNIGNWNVGSVTDMSNMFEGVTLSTANYDSLLTGWDNLTLQNDVTFDGGNSIYCDGEAARNNMINTFNWNISDGGLSSVLLAVCKNITVYLDANGSVIISAGDVDGGSTFGCAEPGTLNISIDTFTCNDIGDNNVILTVTDANGNESTCNSVVTVMDNAPVVSCVPNATRDPDPGVNQYTVVSTEFDATFTDNCTNSSITNDFNGTSTLENEIMPLGNTNVVWTVEDGNGQTATCTTTITIGDNGGPVISCVPNGTRDTDPDLCQYTVVGIEFDATFTADGGNGTITNDLNGTASLDGEVLSNGITTVIWTVDDGNGQTASCTTVITVEDNEAPAVSTIDITLQLDASRNASITTSNIDYGSSDNCGIATMEIDRDTFGCWDLGGNTVTLTVTDINGNSGSATATVTIEDPLQVCGNVFPTDSFVTTWITTTANETITIPTTGAGYDYDIDWGDGYRDGGVHGNATHSYVTPGTHTIAISGDFPRIFFNNSGDRMKIQSIEQWGTNVWSSMNSAFMGATNLVSNATDTPDLSMVTDMYGMFAYAQAFNGGSNIGDWDVSGVTTMYGMFGGAFVFNADISNWNVSNVTNMKLMFSYAHSFNQDIRNWDVSSVRNMESMFRNATVFDQDLGDWNVSNVVNMKFMFKDIALSTTNYDALLIGWSGLVLKQNVSFSAGNSTYCAGATARGILTSVPNNWIITDGGMDCSNPLLGVDKNSSLSGIILYPNPMENQLILGNPKNVLLENASIYDLTGRLIKTVDLRGMTSEMVLDVSILSTATYMVLITGEYGDQILKLLVKE